MCKSSPAGNLASACVEERGLFIVLAWPCPPKKHKMRRFSGAERALLIDGLARSASPLAPLSGEAKRVDL